MAKIGLNINNDVLIKRLKAEVAAKKLSITVDALILAAIEGQFKIEFRTVKGFVTISKEQLEAVFKFGAIAISPGKVRPPPKGASHFEILKSARSRLIEAPIEARLAEAYFREDEILSLVEKKSPSRKHMLKKSRRPRLDQQMTTLKRDQAIISMAEEILRSENGPDYLKNDERTPLKAKLIGPIFKSYSSNEVLRGQVISRNTIRKALVKLKVPKEGWNN